ncbi:MAG: glyceraldehyde 3-phosphate dehydrogenase NAD-binding domain-containing protein, partial [Bacteroidales bacterium]
MKKVAINGLGRIGRATLKIILERDDLDLVAVNDLVPVSNLAYLLKYDTVYGKYEKEVKHDSNSLTVDGQKIKVLNEKDPEKLPWKDLGIELVFESTGIFTKQEELQKHLKAGAEKVILSAPSKSAETATIVHGVNSEKNTDQI